MLFIIHGLDKPCNKVDLNMTKMLHPEDDIRLKKEKSWLGLLAKITFFLCAFVIVIITILANMGGSSDTLKSGLVSFVSRAFNGRPASIDTLINMKFFPSLGVDVEGVHVHPFEGSLENIVNIGKFKAYTDFWNMIIGRQSFKVIYLSDLEVKEGVWGDRAFTASQIAINHDVAQKQAQLRGDGKLGVYDWDLTAGFKISGSSGNYSFSFDNEVPFTFNIADIQMSGTMVHYDGNYITLKNFSLIWKDQQMIGDLSLSVQGEFALNVKGTMKTSAKSQGGITLDIILDRNTAYQPKISGTITAAKLGADEIFGQESLFVFLGRIGEVIALSDLNAPYSTVLDFAAHYDLDLDVSVEGVKTDKAEDNKIKFSVVKTKDYGRISKVSGVFDGVALTVPDVYFAPEGKEGKGGLLALLHGGEFNPANLAYLKHTLPTDFIATPKPFAVSCGQASFVKNGNDFILSGVSLDTAQGKIAHGTAQKNLVLSEPAYGFIRDSMMSVRSDSPCLALISKLPEAVKEEDKAVASPAAAPAAPIKSE